MRRYPAHKVTPLLVQHPDLMQAWKEAAEAGLLRAEGRGKENFVVVADKGLIARLKALGLEGEPTEEA
ncbi:MAG: hypothetical protein NZ846_10240 [Thermus sp.]|uniref:hypothetical protein n=1 Tax=unclassified Thermus TaxID=2619321 RepID=UPI000238917F|nr:MULTISPECIES: hypothetical protein [unclassified Thermus]AEV16990.1 hypothetical protein TCCBUS3UF1_19520 [Thermus sp. CCB_US3_UF1]MCS6869554.1 hypothetical protein [Thermus sp.]MCS7219329.1 hypothetical protein [Thermus sp.]MCX7850437.1 hypothetical protein [Thermus sp.]MDW8018111.1 hypothetical protein [Thermus sp.]